MKTSNTSDMNEQGLAGTSEQAAANTTGKRSLGLKIRTRVGMEVRTNLMTGSSNGQKIPSGYSAATATGCSALTAACTG